VEPSQEGLAFTGEISTGQAFVIWNCNMLGSTVTVPTIFVGCLPRRSLGEGGSVVCSLSFKHLSFRGEAQRSPSALLRAVLRQAQDRESNRTVSLSNGRWSFSGSVTLYFLHIVFSKQAARFKTEDQHNDQECNNRLKFQGHITTKKIFDNP
jgi:hypothetical protein